MRNRCSAVDEVVCYKKKIIMLDLVEEEGSLRDEQRKKKSSKLQGFTQSGASGSTRQGTGVAPDLCKQWSGNSLP